MRWKFAAPALLAVGMMASVEPVVAQSMSDEWNWRPTSGGVECAGIKLLPWCDRAIVELVVRRYVVPGWFVAKSPGARVLQIMQEEVSCWAVRNGYTECAPCLVALGFSAEESRCTTVVMLVYATRMATGEESGGEWPQPWVGPEIVYRTNPVAWVGPGEQAEAPPPCREQSPAAKGH